MEANEAPEKIYLPEEPFKYGDSEKCWNYKPFGSIEYTRTDVIVERAEKYLHEHLVEYWSQRVTDESKFIEDFIDYMKGE